MDVHEAPLDFTLFSGCSPNFPAQAMAEIPNGNLSCFCFFWPQFSRFVLISCGWIWAVEIHPRDKRMSCSFQEEWENLGNFAPFYGHKIPCMCWCRNWKIQGRIIQRKWNFSGSMQKDWKTWALKSQTAAREDNFESLCTGFSKEKSICWITTPESKGDLRILNLIIPPWIFKGV